MVTAVLMAILTLFSPETPPGKAPRSIDVYVFLACDCPISQKYVPTLNSIYTKYKDTPAFRWQFVVPGKVKRSEVDEFIREFDVRFPLESNSRMAKRLHASTTPQVIIVKDSVVYSGAIDNWFYELGKYRREVTENYMLDALQSLKDGHAPAVRETKAIGCPIATSK